MYRCSGFVQQVGGALREQFCMALVCRKAHIQIRRHCAQHFCCLCPPPHELLPELLTEYSCKLQFFQFSPEAHSLLEDIIQKANQYRITVIDAARLQRPMYSKAQELETPAS